MSGAARPPLLAVCLSRTGRRPANEDCALAEVLPGPAVEAFALVCDGMGGHNAGEVASAMCSEILASRVRGAGPLAPLAEPAQELLEWISEANRSVFARSETEVELKGMGTTVAAALVTGDRRLVVANVGDSKVFLVRGPQVTQLSVDHTALAERRRVLGDDEVSPEEEISSPFAHALTRSLGQEPRVLPDSRADVVLEEGDVVVVTSDGVTDVLESERFLRAIESSRTLDGVAEEIYGLAFAGGSRDNISVALLSCGSPARLGVSAPDEGARAPAAASGSAGKPRRAILGAAAAAAIAGIGLAAFLAPRPRAAGRRADAPHRPPAPLVAPLPAAVLAPTSPPREARVPAGRRPEDVPEEGSTLPDFAPLSEKAFSNPASGEAPVALADARIDAARLTRLESAWRLELRFQERVRPAPEVAARVSRLRVVGRETTRPDASYPLACVARDRTLECALDAGDFAPEPPLAAGDAVVLHLEGDGFAFDAQALIGE